MWCHQILKETMIKGKSIESSEGT